MTLGVYSTGESLVDTTWHYVSLSGNIFKLKASFPSLGELPSNVSPCALEPKDSHEVCGKLDVFMVKYRVEGEVE